MSSLVIILGKIVEKIVGVVFQSVVSHVGFVTHYKENLEKLDAEKKILEDQRRKVNEEVGKAMTLGEDIEDDVSKWLTDVNKMREEIEEFMTHETVKENMQCFKFSCPDCISRYQLSKQAERKIGDIKNLSQKGNFGKVSLPRPPPQELLFPSNVNIVSLDYVSFDSRKSAIKKIMDALKDSKVYKIGVHGIGGVGKTTMVEEVGKQVKKDGLFDEVVMAVVSQDVNVEKIQLQLIGGLNPKPNLATVTDERERAIKLQHRLDNGKKNLIILDDIWHEMNLDTIGIPIIDGKGCKVVITSRNRDVWKNMEINSEIHIQELLKLEAWDLFKKKVGNSVDSLELHDIAKLVCNECRGLPIAILLVGAALKSKEKYAWKKALAELKKSKLKKIEGINPMLYNSLKLSYDWLSMDAKSCFLLCCLFPEDANIPIDNLVRYWWARSSLDEKPDTLEEVRDTVLTVVYTLRTSSLLLDGTNKFFVKMHDVIRDVGISIAEDEKEILVKHGVHKWPEEGTYESYSAISLRSKNIRELPKKLACPQLQTLLLECSDDPLVIVPNMFFGRMEKLAVLELNKVCMLQLPSSLAILVNLRMLCLDECKLEDIAILKNLKDNLEILSLWGSDIKVLPSVIGQLTRLRLLDLRNCKMLIEIPQGVISNLSRLEELYIPDSFDQWEAATANKKGSNVSLHELRKLTRLTILHIHIPNFMLLPEDICFKKLIRFRISIGGKLDAWEGYSSTKISKLVRVPLRDEFNVLLEKAEELYLEKVEGLHPLRSFNELSELTINNCKMKYLFSPSCARGLTQIRLLTIWSCNVMVGIVGIEGEKSEEALTSQVINFSKLEYMWLCNLPHLVSFYPKMEKTTTSKENSSTQAQSLFNEKVTFPALEKLYIWNLPMIMEIWDRKLLKSESFCQLREVTIHICDNLVNIVSCNMLQRREIVEDNDNIISFPQLRSLLLRNLQSLKCFSTSRFETQSLFNSQVSFPVLEYLTIANVPNVTEIWDKQLLPLSQLQNMKELRVIDCPNVEVIIAKGKEGTNDDVIVFSQLTTLTLRNLMNLKSFYNWPIISEAQPLFNQQVSFPVLKYLTIEKVPNVTQIWDKQLLPLSQLQNLKKLKVIDCPNVEVIVAKGKEGTNDDVIVFSQLTTLTLQNLMNLKSFYNWPIISEAQPLFNHQVAFLVLEDLIIDGLPNIIEICDKRLLITSKKESKSFCQLKILCVQECPKLKVMVSEKEEEKGPTNNDTIVFSQLTNLYLSDLMNLKSFYSWPTKSEAQTLFNHQVAFPVLENLTIEKLPNIIWIWDKQLLIISEKESKSFCQLKQLRVLDCPKLEVIVSDKEEEKGPTNNDIIVFPQLTSLSLFDLMNLKSFYSWPTRSEPQTLFNQQVAFPKLEYLWLINCVNSSEIHPWNVLAGKISLKDLKVYGCGQISTIASPHLVQRLQNMDKLIVSDCSEVTQVFQLEGLNIGEELPEVRMMEFDGLPQLTCLWNKDPLGILGLQSLQYLTIKKCSLLRNLFTCSTAMALEQLKVLYLESCPMMEEVIATDEEHKEVTGDEIEFPKLEWLILKDLPNLNSFCNANYNFNLPSLQRVVLKRCPKMQTFTSRQVHMSQVLLSIRGNEGLHTEDLNRYLEQRLLNGEECATIDENDYIGEERKFCKLDFVYE